MTPADRLAALAAKRDAARREADQARGAQRQCLERLRKEHGCRTLAEAEALAARLSKELNRLEVELEEALQKAEAEYDGIGMGDQH
jgi:hypothetical protein